MIFMEFDPTLFVQKIFRQISVLCAVVFISVGGMSQSVMARETYEVQSGDNLSKIAAEHGVTVSQLKEWNNLQDDTIFVGDTLQVSAAAAQTEPDAEEPGAAADAETGDDAGSVKIPEGVNPDPAIQEMALSPDLREYVYQVESGDSLNVIARRFDTRVESIRWLNDLEGDQIVIDQKLLIPTTGDPREGFGKQVTSQGILPEEEARYSIKAGESIFSLAREINSTVTRLRWRNNLDTSAVSKGQVLIVPGLEEDDVDQAAVAAAAGEEEQPQVDTGEETREPTDDARTDPGADAAGDGRLVVDPTGPAMPSEMSAEAEEEMARSTELHEYPHRVAPEETLEQIAQKWNSSIAVIRYLNDLPGGEPEANRLLLIPTYSTSRDSSKLGLRNAGELTATRDELLEAGKEVRVGLNDSISGLALRGESTVTRLRWLNRLDDNELEVGTTLVLPPEKD
jgi:LysM repeat protein